MLDFGNKEHLIILEELGIVVQSLAGGRVQVTHVMQKVREGDPLIPSPVIEWRKML